MKPLQYGLVGVVLGLGGVALLSYTGARHEASTTAPGTATSGTISGASVKIGGPFELVDHTGRVVHESDFRGKFLLVYFGYTFCPDVCPTELQDISMALDILGPRASIVQPLFITIDPERDTPEIMADYVSHFHPSLLGLTGTPEQIDTAARAYRVYYARDAETLEAQDNYLMTHSSIIFLISKKGEYLTHFGVASGPEEIAAKVGPYL